MRQRCPSAWEMPRYEAVLRILAISFLVWLKGEMRAACVYLVAPLSGNKHKAIAMKSSRKHRYPDQVADEGLLEEGGKSSQSKHALFSHFHQLQLTSSLSPKHSTQMHRLIKVPKTDYHQQ